MIRPEKVVPAVSVREAIDSKYILTSEDPTDLALLAETKKMLHAKIFEVVGMDQIKEQQRCVPRLQNISLIFIYIYFIIQSHWEDFDVISLFDANISRAGDLTPLVNLIELELTSSLLYSWTTIADIVEQVKTLSYLNLA